MAYAYRRMNPPAQAEMVAERLRRGHPRHAPPHPYRGPGWYLLSAANFEHAAVMHDPARRDEFQEGLLGLFRGLAAEVGGWVVLPNHYHLPVRLDRFQATDRLGRLHGATARQWNLADGLVGRRTVWYRFTDRYIRDEPHYCQALNYIHYNPVKHGVAADPYDWPWSSLSAYREAHGREWLRRRWRDFPVSDFGAGWDD